MTNQDLRPHHHRLRPRRLRRGDPRGAARHVGPDRREGAAPGRRLHALGLHPDQGPAPHGRPARGGAARRGRRRGRARGPARHAGRDEAQGKDRPPVDQRHHVPDEEEPGRRRHGLRPPRRRRPRFGDGRRRRRDDPPVKNVIVATGSTPRSLPGMDIDDKTVLSSTSMLELTEVPKSLVVIGSGAVGVEFASMYARFGAKVTIIEVLPRIVPVEDEEISRELAASFKRQGIAIYPDTRVERITRGEGGGRAARALGRRQDRDLPRREGPHGGRPAAAHPTGSASRRWASRPRRATSRSTRSCARTCPASTRSATSSRRRRSRTWPRPRASSRSSTWRARRRAPSTTTRSPAAPTARPRSARSA